MPEGHNASGKLKTYRGQIVMYDQSLRSLPLQRQEETAPKISHESALHFTDGFRSHGSLTSPRRRRAPPIENAFRECVNLRCSMKNRKWNANSESFVASARHAYVTSLSRTAPPPLWTVGAGLSHFCSILSNGNKSYPHPDFSLVTLDFSLSQTTHAHRLPIMDSESDHDHDHRDDESVSEDDIAETKPKSALKKTREAPAPVERPELP